MAMVFTVNGINVVGRGPGFLIQIMRKEGEPAEQKITWVPDGQEPAFSAEWWDFTSTTTLAEARAAYPDAWLLNPEEFPPELIFRNVDYPSVVR